MAGEGVLLLLLLDQDLRAKLQSSAVREKAKSGPGQETAGSSPDLEGQTGG